MMIHVDWPLVPDADELVVHVHVDACKLQMQSASLPPLTILRVME